MKLVRRGTFETNSSSTHSITMCSESTFDKWKNGEIFFCRDDNKFYNEEDRITEIKKTLIHKRAKYDSEPIRHEDGHYTYITSYTYNGITVSELDELFTDENMSAITQEDIDEFIEAVDYYEIPLSYEEYNDWLEANYEDFEERYTTESGEVVISFGYYGSDY